MPFSFSRMTFHPLLRREQRTPINYQFIAHWVTPIALLLLFAIRFVPPFSSYYSLTYGERNSLSAQASIIGSSGGIIIFYTIAMTFVNAWVYALILNHHRQVSISKPLYCALWAWVIYESLNGLLLGSRISLALPLILIVLVNLSRRQNVLKRFFIVTPAVTIASIFIVFLAVIVADLRLRQGLGTSLSPGEIVTEAAESGSTALTDIAAEVTQKFNSIDYGAALVEGDGSARAGYQSYIGGLLSLVPRQILPSKPVPGSRDGTWFGHYSRVATIAMGGDGDLWNVGISPAMATIWQVGYSGLPIMIILNMIFLAFCNTLLKANSLALNAVGFYIIGLPTMVYFIAPIEQVLMLGQRAAILAILVCIAGFLFYRGRPRAPGPSPRNMRHSRQRENLTT